MASLNPKDMIRVSPGLESTKPGQAYVIKNAEYTYTYNPNKAQAAVNSGNNYFPAVMLPLTCQLVHVNGLTPVEEDTTRHQFYMGNTSRFTILDENGNALEPIMRALDKESGEKQPSAPFSKDNADPIEQNRYKRDPEFITFCKQLQDYGVDLSNASTDDIRFLQGIVFTCEVTVTPAKKEGDYENRVVKVTGVVARPQETGKKATAAVPATPKPAAAKPALAAAAPASDADPTELALGFINDVLPGVLRPKAGATLTRGALNVAIGQALIKVRSQYPNITSNNITDTLMVDGVSRIVTFDGANFVIASAEAF